MRVAFFRLVAWRVTTALLVGYISMPSAVWAATVGPSRPTTIGEDQSVGFESIINTSNLTDTDPETFVSASNNTSGTYYATTTGYGFSVPGGATINGVTADFFAWDTGIAGTMPQIRLIKGGVISGDTKSVDTVTLTTTHQTISVGGSSDLWGLSLSSADVNASDFGLAFTINQIAQGAARVGDLQLTVTYTVGTGNNTPVATTPSSISQATNGSGYVAFTTKVSDVDGNRTQLLVEYSSNQSNWKKATIQSVGASQGSVSIKNNDSYQIQSIDTDTGQVTLTVVWDSKKQFPDTAQGAMYIRITPNDGTTNGTAKVSDSFSIDNAPPIINNLHVISATNSTLKMGWGVDSAGESHFSGYILCVAAKLADAKACNGSAIVWDKNDDLRLAVLTTRSTTISGLQANKTYAVVMFANDTFGNQSMLTLSGVKTTNVPSPTPTSTPFPTPTLLPTPEPTPACGPDEVYEHGACVLVASVTPAPTPEVTPEPSPESTPSPTPEPGVLGAVEEIVENVVETVVEVIQQVIEIVVEVVQAVKEIIVELEPQRLAESARRVVEKIPEVVNNLRQAESVAEVREALAPLAEEPVVYVAATVAAPVAAVAVTSSGFSLTTTIAQTFQQVPAAVGRLWQGMLGLVGFRRRKRSWGRTVDLMTGKPLPGVVVEVYDHATARLKDTMVTNTYGAFESLLPVGTYDLRVQKEGYAVTPEAPWLKLAGGEQVYDGRPITIQEERAVPFVVTLRPLAVAATSWRLALRTWVRRMEIVVGYFSWPLLLIGFLLNSLTLFVKPTVLNVIVETVYILLMALKAWIAWRFNQFVSRVVDGGTGAPISQATVRLMDVMTDKVVSTKVTSGKGAVQLLPPPGVYTVEVAAPGYAAYRESHVIVRGERGGITLTMRLQPIGQASSESLAISSNV